MVYNNYLGLVLGFNFQFQVFLRANCVEFDLLNA